MSLANTLRYSGFQEQVAFKCMKKKWECSLQLLAVCMIGKINPAIVKHSGYIHEPPVQLAKIWFPSDTHYMFRTEFLIYLIQIFPRAPRAFPANTTLLTRLSPETRFSKRHGENPELLIVWRSGCLPAPRDPQGCTLHSAQRELSSLPCCSLLGAPSSELLQHQEFFQHL